MWLSKMHFGVNNLENECKIITCSFRRDQFQHLIFPLHHRAYKLNLSIPRPASNHKYYKNWKKYHFQLSPHRVCLLFLASAPPGHTKVHSSWAVWTTFKYPNMIWAKIVKRLSEIYTEVKLFHSYPFRFFYIVFGKERHPFFHSSTFFTIISLL